MHCSTRSQPLPDPGPKAALIGVPDRDFRIKDKAGRNKSARTRSATEPASYRINVSKRIEGPTDGAALFSRFIGSITGRGAR